MYNKIKYFFLTATAIVSFAACTKTDIQPEYILNGDLPAKDLQLVEGELNGAYAAFRSVNYYGSSAGSAAFSSLPDMMGGDLIETFESLGNYRVMSEWKFASDEGWVEATWAAAYRVISRANRVLRDVDAFAAENPKKVNRLKGQALAIRAHAHFDIMRYWAPDFKRNSTALAAPYMTSFENVPPSKPSRLSVKQYYDNILADLATAKSLLAPANIDKAIGSVTDRSMIDQVAVFAILARVNLYAEQWSDAATNADLASAARPIETLANFGKIWKDEPTSEVIWSVKFSTQTEGAPYENVYFVRGDRLSFQPTYEMVDDLDLYALNDGRFDSYMVYDLKRPKLLKYIGRGTATDGVVDWKAYRSSEMALISAEAKARIGGQDAAALTTLNTLRSKRYFSSSYPNPATNAALLAEILRQRRLELFAEGHRFFDLKRLGKQTFTRSDCDGSTVGVQYPSSICTINNTNRGWTWPIPFNDIVVNPNLSQNIGY
jgi:starch-binding outer membrane protein, SusD/RagB family